MGMKLSCCLTLIYLQVEEDDSTLEVLSVHIWAAVLCYDLSCLVMTCHVLLRHDSYITSWTSKIKAEGRKHLVSLLSIGLSSTISWLCKEISELLCNKANENSENKQGFRTLTRQESWRFHAVGFQGSKNFEGWWPSACIWRKHRADQCKR
jgi:hypothetical protein